MIELKVERNLQEVEVVSRLKNNFDNSINPEEQLFEKFRLSYQRLEKHLKTCGYYDETVIGVILSSVLDQWAFALDSSCHRAQGVWLTRSESSQTH